MNAQLDMHNKITATQLHRMVKLQLDTLAKRPELAAVLPPLMVWGAPGLGKSTILREAAREAGNRTEDRAVATTTSSPRCSIRRLRSQSRRRPT